MLQKIKPSFLCYFQLHSNSDEGDGSVQYLLSGEGAGSIFIINELTGDIHAKKSLDREKKSHYVLHARAIDRFTNRAVEPESEFIIKVQDVNDNAPKFPDGLFSASVPEMADIGEPTVRTSWLGGLSEAVPGDHKNVVSVEHRFY